MEPALFPSGHALHAAHPGMSASCLGDGWSAAAPQEAPHPAPRLWSRPHEVSEPGQWGGGAVPHPTPTPPLNPLISPHTHTRLPDKTVHSNQSPFALFLTDPESLKHNRMVAFKLIFTPLSFILHLSQISSMLLFVKHYKEEVLGVGEVALPGEGGALREAASQRAAKEPKDAADSSSPSPTAGATNGTHDDSTKTEYVSPECPSWGAGGGVFTHTCVHFPSLL